MPYVIELKDSSTQYDQFQYPMGEWQVRLKKDTIEAIGKDKVIVLARLRDSEQIIKLALLASALNNINAEDEVVLPYLPYSRADRAFTEGDCSGLDVWGDMLDGMLFSRVRTVDTHNIIAADRFIGDLVNVGVTDIIGEAVKAFAAKHNTKNVFILCPDEGAKIRYKDVWSTLDMPPVAAGYCTKERDEVTGIVHNVTLPEIPDGYYPFVVDDICDGGSTFLQLAERMPNKRAGLYVTHGIFSRGCKVLLKSYDLFTTNTIANYHIGSPTEAEPFHVFDVVSPLLQ